MTGIPRIALIRQQYNSTGGAERFVSRAICALLTATEPLDVLLIARRWEKIDGLVPWLVNPFYLGNVWRDWGFCRAVRRLLQQQAFDLVQSHERIPGCDIYRAGDGVHARWLTLRRQTLPWQRRLSLSLNPYHHYVCQVERKMFLHPSLRLVICNSYMVKAEIQRYFGVSDERCTVIYNGVDTVAFHPDLQYHYRLAMRAAWGIDNTAALLLYVGSGYERKGVARAIRAIALTPDTHLMVVGKDNYIRRYQRLVSELGLVGRVHFAGSCQDVRPFYGMADAFIFPTLYDPFPNVCVEALASGLPVITTTTCGASELITIGQNGWVVDALDQQALVDVIRVWYEARPSWKALAKAARTTAEPLTLENMTSKLVACYQTLLPRSARKSSASFNRRIATI